MAVHLSARPGSVWNLRVDSKGGTNSLCVPNSVIFPEAWRSDSATLISTKQRKCVNLGYRRVGKNEAELTLGDTVVRRRQPTGTGPKNGSSHHSKGTMDFMLVVYYWQR